jgi:agmatinase
MISMAAALIGIPWDASSSFLRGAAGAPPAIRAALQSPSSNSWSERGTDVSAPGVLEDAGDLELGGDAAAARAAIESGIAAVLARGQVPIALGGDHSITYPVLRAFRGRVNDLTIVHVDAHGDLYDEFEGDRFSHACPFARIMEEGLASRLVQIGVRTLTAHQREQAKKFGVEIYDPGRWTDAPLDRLTPPLYVSIDLDGLDPAHAPGVSHPEPGGLSTRDVISIVHRLPCAIVGADVVEYNPLHDVRDLTARVAARLVKELVAIAAQR